MARARQGRGGASRSRCWSRSSAASRRRYPFDQPRVLVGRGVDADLRIEHAAVSRSQFLVERGVGSAGEPRFRITPYETTNPTLRQRSPRRRGHHHARRPDRRRRRARGARAQDPARRAGEQKKDEIPPLRMVLLARRRPCMALVRRLPVVRRRRRRRRRRSGHRADQAVRRSCRRSRCGNPVECDTRAHDAYARGQEADWRRRRRSGQPLSRGARVRQGGALSRAVGAAAGRHGRRRARSPSRRARAPRPSSRTPSSACTRAIAAGDLKRCAVEAALLARIVPDEQHPYRVKLDAYRRTLPKPKTGEVTMRQWFRRSCSSLRLLLAGCAAPQRDGRAQPKPSDVSPLEKKLAENPNDRDRSTCSSAIAGRGRRRPVCAPSSTTCAPRRSASPEDEIVPRILRVLVTAHRYDEALERCQQRLDAAARRSRHPLRRGGAARRARSAQGGGARARLAGAHASPTIRTPISRSARSTATSATRARAHMFEKYLALAPDGEAAAPVRFELADEPPAPETQP